MNILRLGACKKAMTKSVCIVGAGPSGLVAAKTLLHNAPVKDEYNVSVFDAQLDIGGLWPTSKDDSQRQVHPLMVANQSKHTMHFSDQAWNEDAPQLPLAWQVGQYLQRYKDRYLTGHSTFDIHLGTRVVRAQRVGENSKGHWDVVTRSQNGEETKRHFDYLLVSTGFFGKPILPECLATTNSVPVMHSSQYRDLKGLIGNGRSRGRKILVVGGQMSGVEIAGTIASHVSSAINSPEDSDIPDIDKYTVHHVVQRPTWVFPLYASPEPKMAAAPFLPVDFGAYNRNNRPQPLVNTQGHISEATAQILHGIFQNTVGNDQSMFSPQLGVDDEAKTKQPYLAMSDWYCDFVRSGLISLSNGKLQSLEDNTAKITPSGDKISDIAAVVVATGFDASPCMDFLSSDVLKALHHSPQHIDQPVALAFHGTHHPDVPGLGFVGFYRSPYWGVMQMQARFLAQFWSDAGHSETLCRKAQEDGSIQRTLGLRDDPRTSQFPMGDYPFLMQEFGEALGIDIQPPLGPFYGPGLSHNHLPLDMLTPARYPLPSDAKEEQDDAKRLTEDTQRVAIEGLTTPRFVARAVFRSLLGTWRLERDLVSKLPSHPSGHFSGTAQFLLREKTSDGLQCVVADTPAVSQGDHPSPGMEYLYIEDGEFKTDHGFGFRATRRYIWRYDEDKDAISVWFAKPEEQKRADYLFHEIEFEQPPKEWPRDEGGWRAKAGHLCIDDFYDVKYRFAFEAVNLRDWGIEYQVKGPKKDYTIRGTYRR